MSTNNPQTNLPRPADDVISGPGKPNKQSGKKSSNKMIWPTSPKGVKTSGFGMRWGRMHEGLDIGVLNGTKVLAVLDGKVESAQFVGGYGNYMVVSHGNNTKTAYAHLESYKAKVGDNVRQGQIIALSNNTGSSTGPHLHFEVIVNGTRVDPEPYLNGAEVVDGTDGDGGGGGGGGGADGESLAKAAAFATFFQLASALDIVEAQALTGERSYMNDKPLMPFIQQLTEASMRNFQSMPNGNFFAFYPDYFGGMNHRTPYWKIKDTEIIDGTIDLSDDKLATHVYVVGSWYSGNFEPVSSAGGIPWPVDKINSQGVITIFNAFMVDFLNGTTNLGANRKKAPKGKKEILDKDDAVKFLQKYGARPHFEDAPFVKNPYYELFLAFQRFCLLWAEQFSTNFTFTFMPELFPGGLIEFEDHGIQCYIEEVSHTCSYSSGFTTNAVLSAPASTSSVSPKNPKDNKNIGMIRAGIFGPEATRAK